MITREQVYQSICPRISDEWCSKYTCEECCNIHLKSTFDEYEQTIANNTIDKLKKWCKQQSTLLQKQSDAFDSEECFGGHRAFDDMIRYLDEMKEVKCSDK